MSDATPTLPDKTPGGYENASALHTLLEAIAARLESQDLIAATGVRVLPEFAGDLYSKLVQVMNKKLGALIVVGFDQVNKGDSSLSVFFRRMEIVIDCYESVLLNQSSTGTRTSALTLAEACAIHLHQWQPAKTAVLVNPGVLSLTENGTLFMDRDKGDPAKGLICYSARLTCGGCLAAHNS